MKTPSAPPTEPSRVASGGRSLADGTGITWTTLACALLLFFTVFTRFDHLGEKPHHHDESMHAFYSYQLFKDGDYKYDPMMHGPFQFHGSAVMYYLFGVSDASSRYLAAFFGVLTVALPLLLTPFLGRMGAFLAMLLLAFSPSFMYFDRFTREDAYIAGATLLMVVFLFRYYRSRQPLDLWLASLGFVVAFCKKESMFITIAVIGTYLFIRLLPWMDVLLAGGLTIFALLTQVIIPKGQSIRTPLLLVILAAALLYTLFQLFMRWRENLRASKPESPLWGAVMGLGFEKVKWELAALAGVWFLIYLLHSPLTGPKLSFIPRFSSFLLLLGYLAVLFRFCWLWLRNVVPALSGSIAVIGILFTLLFTTFFTVGDNQSGFQNRFHELTHAVYMGAFGGLDYWWDQHDVKRGDQPWYYYLVQLPANELVSYLFSALAMVYYGFFRRKNLPLFLAYWYLGSLSLFSWAGEKMPWLILHPLLPALLLAAYFLGEILESRPTEQFKRAAKAASLAVFGILLTYSLHSAVLLSFYHEANPVESLVYVQSGTDTKEVERIVRRIAYEETGGTDFPITIEDKCSWPFAWSMKDFPRRNHPSTITMADNPIIMTGTESDAQAYPLLSEAGYVNRKYKLRVWWVPSWFKKGFPGRPMSTGLFREWFFGNFLPIGQARPDMVDWGDLRRWVLYRQVWSDLGSYNMRLWVRTDLAERYGFTDTNRSDVPADYPKTEPAALPSPMGKKGTP